MEKDPDKMKLEPPTEGTGPELPAGEDLERDPDLELDPDPARLSSQANPRRGRRVLVLAAQRSGNLLDKRGK